MQKLIAIAVLCLFSHTTAIAMAPDYGAITAILYLVLAGALVVWLLGLAIFRAAGGRRGVALYLLLSAGALVAWKLYINHQSSDRVERARLARLSESAFCRTQSGEHIYGHATPADSVYLRVDPRLTQAFGQFNSKAFSSGQSSRLTVVSALPDPRPPGAAFVDIRFLLEPVPNAEGWMHRGYEVDVSLSDGTKIGVRKDIERNRGQWCLGGSADFAVARFVSQLIEPALIIPDDSVPGSPATVPVKASPAQVAERRAGRFREREFQIARAPDKELVELLSRFGCVPEPHPDPFVPRAICSKGTPGQNVLEYRDLLASIALDNGWLGVSNVYVGGLVDSLDVTRRNSVGAVVGRWRFLFEPISADPFKEQRLAIDTARLDGPDLSVRLLWSRGTSTSGQVAKEWYENSVQLRMTLGVPE